jgi:hypothetical protein
MRGEARVAWQLAVATLAVTSTAACRSLRAQSPVRPQTAVVTGVVQNAATSAPVRIAVIRQAGGLASTLSDDAGRFRLELPLGERRLEVRRLGFRPASVTLTLRADTSVVVPMEPLAVALERVVVTADDAAQRIVRAAIRRKQEMRGRVHDYRYEGDVLLVIRNLSKPVDSASSIVLMTQTRTSAYWEQPNRYQETIVARRQTGNVSADQNLVSAGPIADFSRDQVQMGRFELASPVADDALDRYDYRVLDTLAMDGRRILRLSLEPKPNGSPAFVGIIDIADSTFDLVGIDVGVNDAVRLGLVRNVRYQQRLADVGGGRWMPREIELSLDIALPLGGPKYKISHSVALSGFRFDLGARPAGLNEYSIVVAADADRAGSSNGAHAGAVQLTPLEREAWTRIDSIARAPRSPARRLVRAGVATLTLASNPNVFHYNRVDGAYVGAAVSVRDPVWRPDMEMTFKLGHAQASGLWQYRVGDRLQLSDAHRLWVGASYHDETRNRASLTSPDYNPTFRALFSTIDPLDYYRERALELSATTKLIDFVRLDATYLDATQSSLPLAVAKPPFRRSDGPQMRPNEMIDDGHFRTLSAAVSYDSRAMARQDGVDIRLQALEWTRLSVGGELSPGRVLGSDRDYRQLGVRFDRQQQTFGLGVTSVVASGGIGSSELPAQRYLGVDGGAQVLDYQVSPFSTLLDSSVSAPRAAVLSVQHDFDRLLFSKSQLPLVRDIPFTLAVRASIFWAGGAGAPTDRLVVRAPYREAGFSIGNLTPFIAPFNLAARFAWQLSGYPTTPFRFSVGVSP